MSTEFTYEHRILLKVGEISPVQFLQRLNELLKEANYFNFLASTERRVTQLLEQDATMDTQAKDSEEAQCHRS